MHFHYFVSSVLRRMDRFLRGRSDIIKCNQVIRDPKFKRRPGRFWELMAVLFVSDVTLATREVEHTPAGALFRLPQRHKQTTKAVRGPDASLRETNIFTLLPFWSFTVK